VKKVIIGYGCTVCGDVRSREDWIAATSIEVIGYYDPTTVSEIAEPTVRADSNNFWICPSCVTQVHGHQITVEHGLMKHGKVEEVEDDTQEAEVQVNLTIVLPVEGKYTREEILGRIHDILLEGVDPSTSVEAIFDQILIEGIDY
jgi:ribosomal protein S16